MTRYPIVRLDNPAQNPDSNSRFYLDLFGWQMQFLPAMAYIRFQTSNEITGGIVGSGEPEQLEPGKMLVYVGSDDIDSDLKKAEQL